MTNINRQFSTEVFLSKKMEEAMKEYALDVANRKVKVICECKTKEEAEDKIRKISLVGQWDMDDCCSQIQEVTGAGINPLRENDLAVSVDNNDFITCPDIMASFLR